MALDAFALLLSMLALGKLGARIDWLARNGAAPLHTIVLMVCLPASILRHVPRLEIGVHVLGIAAVPWMILLASVLAVHVLTRTLSIAAPQRAVLMLCVPLGNTSFLGYPLVRALLGEAAMPAAVIYDQLGSFLILSTWGLWIVARSGGGKAPSLPALALRLVAFPPVVALALALTVMPVDPPPLVATALQWIAGALLPIAAFAVGLGLSFRIPKGELAPVVVGLALKLIVMPAIALGLVIALDLPPQYGPAVVLETAMPPMITAGALAISAGIAPSLASALVGYGTLIALASLPAWAWLVG